MTRLRLYNKLHIDNYIATEQNSSGQNKRYVAFRINLLNNIFVPPLTIISYDNWIF